MTTKKGLAAATVLLSLACWPVSPTTARSGDSAHQQAAHDHAHHMAAAQETHNRTMASYDIPGVTLINQHGSEVALKDLLDSEQAVLLNFIFATCATVCPVLTAGFASFEAKLASEARPVQLVSVTIDPEHDTAEVLGDYAKRFGAGSSWQFLTGAREDINAVMTAFDAFVSNKMNHRPLTFVHAPDAEQWTRVEGFMSGADYLDIYEALAKK